MAMRLMRHGLLIIGRSSLGIAFVAGKNREPNPATGKTAFFTSLGEVLPELLL